MTDETGNPYPFDFFETIVGISFPQAGGYVLLTITASTTVNGTTAPPCPQVLLTLGPKEKLIQKQEACKPKFTPAKDSVIPVFFVFNNVAGPVTLANYQNVINSSIFPAALFATQFARIVGSPTGFKDPEAFGVEPVPEGGSGFFSTAAIAQGYANSWNAHIHGAAPGSGVAVFLSDGSTLDANPAPVSVQRLDQPVHTPATATSNFTGKYLIKVPTDLTTLLAKVSIGPGSSFATIFGYHGKVPANIGAIPAGSDDSSNEAQLNQTGTYTITSVLTKDPISRVSSNAVTISAGGGHVG